ncbi:hypothetical protein ACG7TL_002520, partial [Trametes sanguinea]
LAPALVPGAHARGPPSHVPPPPLTPSPARRPPSRAPPPVPSRAAAIPSRAAANPLARRRPTYKRAAASPLARHRNPLARRRQSPRAPPCANFALGIALALRAARAALCRARVCLLLARTFRTVFHRRIPAISHSTTALSRHRAIVSYPCAVTLASVIVALVFRLINHFSKGNTLGRRFSSGLRQQTYGPKALKKAKLESQQRYEQATSGLSAESLHLLATMRGESSAPSEDPPLQDVIMADAEVNDDGWEDEPAEEEDRGQESMAYAIRDLLESRPNFRKYKDTRTWRRRVRNLDENWRPLLPHLVDAYPAWRNGDATPQDPSPSEYDFEIDVLDFYSTSRATVVPRAADVLSPAEALVRHGYLGNVPLNPSLAVSLKTLELLRVFRLFKPSLSFEAFTKMLCYMYTIPYRRHFRTAISDAFDIYLTVLRHVDQRIQASLGRDTPDWRVKNACPPCGYELEGETPSIFSRKVVIDGNNSLKRLAPTGCRSVGDMRVFVDSKYYLLSDFVERYADEVKGRQGQQHVAVPTDRDAGEPDAAEPDAADEDGDETLHAGEGDPTDGSVPSSCTTNWKAAAAEDKKRMWGIFEECGIFACACRHGLILYIVDMVRSGELAKYALAIIAKLCEVLGDRLLIGYDIGCAFEGTLSRSSLGPRFFAGGSRMCVNAFHGYSHAYPCQLRYHPNGIVGMGLEDLETLERVFSASNQLAPITRHASAFRRRMLIDTFFQQWDDEKYQNLGEMLYNNYVQALEIISDLSLFVADSMRSLAITADDLARFEKEEREYFAALSDEAEWDVHAVAYVEALQQLRALNEELQSTTSQFYRAAKPDYRWLPPENGPTEYNASLSATRKLETSRRALREKIDNLTAEIVGMEVRLDVSRRWQPGDREYEETRKYIVSRQYHRALGKLQRLVVQRLFELHRMNLSQTAYRVRTYIAKNLQKRCQAIRRAIDEYNKAAALLDPPRPALDWSKVSHFSFIEEFTLLQDTRNDLRDKLWSQPVAREMMRKARRIQRAHEEITNVNREIRRLHTSIRDEDAHFTAVLDSLRARKDPLYSAVLEFCTRRRSANARNLVFIQRLYDLDGFTGDPTPGVRCGGVPSTAGDPITTSPQYNDGTASAVDSGIATSDALQAAADDVAQPTDSHTLSSEPVLEGLATAELLAIRRDEDDTDVELDEDDVADIGALVDHMSNIAVSM